MKVSINPKGQIVTRITKGAHSISYFYQQDTDSFNLLITKQLDRHGNRDQVYHSDHASIIDVNQALNDHTGFINNQNK